VRFTKDIFQSNAISSQRILILNNDTPLIPVKTHLPEITVKVVVLSIILTIILATSNAYLALKVGILTSASIPAAVISMGILRLFKQANILENNLVQTAASAGEAVAGGIVYTVPALIIMHYWTHFSYWQNVFIVLIGGGLGVLFSIPIRRVLVQEKSLGFPEGKAIAEVLQMESKASNGLREIILGGVIGAALEFAQTGLKVFANSLQAWFIAGRALFGFGAGFSATLIGAGYLVGFEIGLSIFAGALIGWFLAVPIISEIYGYSLTVSPGHITDVVMVLWGEKIRYIGIGAMMVSGIWTIATLAKPFLASMQLTLKAFHNAGKKLKWLNVPRTDRDIPLTIILIAILILLIANYIFFDIYFPLASLGFNNFNEVMFLIASAGFILFVGFTICAICGYFSGMVGVTATPGSAIVIAGMLLAAIILRWWLHQIGMDNLSKQQLLDAAAITIFFSAIITGSAAIANDNIQDLKVGYILGATPWKQQVMLLMGVVVAAFVVPPVMDLLFNVYGIGDVFPHTGMDKTQVLAAPPAALMAGIAQSVFRHNLPWDMLIAGMVIAIVGIIINGILHRKQLKGFSVLGIAVGIYLPLTTSTPLFIGALLSKFINNMVNKQQKKNQLNDGLAKEAKQRGVVIACGLVAGAALMDVILAIPFGFFHNPNILRVMPANLVWFAGILAILATVALGLWMYRSVRSVAKR